MTGDAQAAKRFAAARRHAEARKRARHEQPPAHIRDALRLMALEDLLFPEVAPSAS